MDNLLNEIRLRVRYSFFNRRAAEPQSRREAELAQSLSLRNLSALMFSAVGEKLNNKQQPKYATQRR